MSQVLCVALTVHLAILSADPISKCGTGKDGEGSGVISFEVPAKPFAGGTKENHDNLPSRKRITRGLTNTRQERRKELFGKEGR
jgi:hypothetical protein